MANKRFDRKKIQANLGRELGAGAATMGGMILSKKFLAPDLLLKNQPDDNFFKKNFQIIKALGAFTYLAATTEPTGKGKKEMTNIMIRRAILGIGLEGGITAIRKLTINEETGEAFFDKLGQSGWGAPSSQQPRTVAEQLDEGVAGTEDIMVPPGTGVAGMEDYEDDEMDSLGY